MRNYLTIAGRDSREFGVYISGQGTFSAPERAYEFLPIPGRDGALIGNEKRLENMEVSYEAFIYENFSENIANFRSFLLSLIGYQRLEDSYHPDEFRMACYVGPFEPEVEDSNDAGKFTITFNCKPQRFLKDGETTYVYSSSGGVVSGSKIVAYGSLIDPTYFKVSALQSQDPKMWRKIRVNVDGEEVFMADINTITVGGITSIPASGELDLITGQGKVYDVAVPLKSASSGWTKSNIKINGTTRYYYRHAKIGVNIQLPYAVSPENTYGVKRKSGTLANSDITDMINSADQSHKPYFGFDSSYMYFFASTFDSAASTTNAVGSYFASRDLYAFSSNPNQGTTVQLIDTLFEPEFPGSLITIQCDTYYWGPVIETHINYLPTDSMLNPSVFPSKPLIRAYGTGSFDINDITITITSSSTYTDIDCDLMDCYEGSTNRNNDVAFSTYDFPILQPGENLVHNIAGITFVEITPRWWRL